MRVLSVGNMYPPQHEGGYELLWRGAVECLRERGHSVRVLTTDYVAPAPDHSLDEGPDVYRELEWYWRDHEFRDLSIRARLSLERHNLGLLDRHLREFSPDVVSWWAMGGMSMALIEAVRRRRIPAVGFVINDWMIHGLQGDQWLRRVARLPVMGRVVERVTGIPARVDFGAAATWAFVSDYMLAETLSSGFRLPRIEVTHAGIETSLFRPAPAHPWEGRLLYVGRLDRYKGIDTALRALALLPAMSLQLVGSGAGAYRAELDAVARSLGVQDRVTFELLPRAELPRAYAEADAVLFPTLWNEPWGLVPLEAMAVGTPVIASGTGGSREYLDHERNCLIFEPRDDAESLATAISRLASDESLRRRLREGGLETAPRYSEDAFNALTAKLVERAARKD